MNRPYLINFLVNGGLYLSFFYIPTFGRTSLNLSPKELNDVQILAALLVMICGYMAGWAADRFGRWPLIVFGITIGAAGYVQIFMADGLPLYLTGRLTVGASTGLFVGALTAYTSDAGHSLGGYSAAASLGATVFLLIAAQMTHMAGSSASAILLAAGLFCAGALAAFSLKKISWQRSRQSLWPGGLLKKNRTVYLCAFLRHTGAASMWSLWAVYLLELGSDHGGIGLINACNTGMQFLMAYFLLDRMRSRLALNWGLALSFLSFYSYAFVSNAYQLIPSQLVLGASWTFFYAGSLKILDEVNPRQKAAAVGMLSSVMSVSFIVGPLITKLILSLLPGWSFVDAFRVVIVFAGTCALAASVIAWRLPPAPAEPGLVVQWDVPEPEKGLPEQGPAV